MIFYRSQDVKSVRDYTQYRGILRVDFQFRCAYCLTHEYFLGGEAGCTIDHFQPLRGLVARPDLAATYSNLFWCCRECNENKGDSWPVPDQFRRGQHFLNPCNPEDDHDLHWRILPDGTLEPTTPAGEYTIEHLKLWRPQLMHHRARVIHYRSTLQQIDALLRDRDVDEQDRTLLEQRITEIESWLNPPVFDRPRSPHPRN
jgi:hypothetical protein